MESENRRELHAACAEMSLTPDKVAEVEELASDLRRFEEARWNGTVIRTHKQRIRDLECVKHHSKELSKAISSLSGDTWLEMRQAIRESEFPGRYLEFTDEVKQPMSKWDLAVIELLSVVHDTAEIQRKDLEREAPKGGPMRKQKYYVTFIANISYLLRIPPTRNSPFHRLCDAVFCLAGVEGGAEGVIKEAARLKKSSSSYMDVSAEKIER